MIWQYNVEGCDNNLDNGDYDITPYDGILFGTWNPTPA
jgi:hypothetical protein